MLLPTESITVCKAGIYFSFSYQLNIIEQLPIINPLFRFFLRIQIKSTLETIVLIGYRTIISMQQYFLCLSWCILLFFCKREFLFPVFWKLQNFYELKIKVSYTLFCLSFLLFSIFLVAWNFHLHFTLFIMKWKVLESKLRNFGCCHVEWCWWKTYWRGNE